MAGMRDTRSFLADDPEAKWGFVIYRTTYQDDGEWKRFMEHINKRVRLVLEEHGDAELFSRIDWCVQEDTELDSARIDEVRKRFENWIKNGGEKITATPRFRACIVVSQFNVERVLGGPPAEEPDTWGQGWVDVVSRNEEEGDVAVGASYLIPRAWSLLWSVGWSGIEAADDNVFCN